MAKRKLTRGYIKALRRRLNMTQQELAYALDVAFITVVRWEKKRNNSSPSKLAANKLKELENKNG